MHGDFSSASTSFSFLGFLFPLCFLTLNTCLCLFLIYYIFTNSDLNLYLRHFLLGILPHQVSLLQIPHRESRCLPWIEQQGVGIMEARRLTGSC